jgi:mycothiol synthase
MRTPRGPLVSAIEVAAAAAPDEVTIRPWRGPADYEAMVTVFHAARPVDGTNWDVSPASLAADITGLGSRPEDSVLIAEVGDQVIGWVRMSDLGLSNDAGRRLIHTGQVDPAWRRKGIGGALLVGAQAELRRIRAAKPSPEGTADGIETFVHAANTSTISLLEPDGYRPRRYMIEMVRSLDEVSPVELPAGLTTRPVKEEDRRSVLLALDAAMKDHPGWPAWTEDQLVGMSMHPNRGQLDVWQVAWDGGRVVGGVLGFVDDDENATLGLNRGYTEGIFTIREYRGRGVAGALISRNLALLRARGLTEAALSVDTENPSGALGLYQHHGFREAGRMIFLRKDLA